MYDPTMIRRQSLAIAASLGYATNQSLPLLDDLKPSRSFDETIDRLLGMLCVAATAYGFDHSKANRWFERETKTDQLTEAEHSFLTTGAGNSRQFMRHVEGMWVLAWAISIVPLLDFTKPCSETFVTLLPNLKTDTSASKLRSKALLRPRVEIVSAADLAYCLHWAVRDAELSATALPGKVEPWRIVERREHLSGSCLRIRGTTFRWIRDLLGRPSDLSPP